MSYRAGTYRIHEAKVQADKALPVGRISVARFSIGKLWQVRDEAGTSYSLCSTKDEASEVARFVRAYTLEAIAA